MNNILQQHEQVFLDLLDADNTGPALAVLDGKVPTGQTVPYVLVYFADRTPSGVDEPEKVSKEATSDVIITTVTCHSVADTQRGASAVAGRVRAALLGKTPVIAGRVCFPIVHHDDAPTTRDETTLAPTFDRVDQYRFTSLPA